MIDCFMIFTNILQNHLSFCNFAALNTIPLTEIV